MDIPHLITTNKTVFTVVLPTYNRSHLLSRAINSVLNQTFTDYELIVIDDCSTDQTQQVLSAFNDPRLTVLRQHKNTGISAARNRGIQQAQGQYICFLDDDNAFLSDFLATTFHHLTSYPSIDFTWCGQRQVTVYPNGQIQTRDRIWDIASNQKHSLEFLHFLVLGAGGTIKKSCFEHIGLFDEEMTTAEDADLLLRLLNQGCHYAAIPSVHSEVFVHAARENDHFKAVRSLEHLIYKNRIILNQQRVLRVYYQNYLMERYYRAGLVPEARKLAFHTMSPKMWMRSLLFELKRFFY